MKTKIVDIQEFNTSLGILRIETHISEVSEFKSVVENKIIYNGQEFSDAKALEEKLDRYEYDLLRNEVEKLSTLLDLYMQAYPRTL
ncbi:MAG: hypothetical protein IJZ35_02110 [Clostridia bacterium]|nr:hypothetical protein [Clostridia bacterium]